MIKRYYATKDNTITNAFEENLQTRGTGSNMGASDILEVFSIYGQQSSGSAELARVLIEFDVDAISSDRSSNAIPASGSVSFYLKLYNAPHSQTVPRNYTLTVSAISGSWEEGYGMDMESYEDRTKERFGSDWLRAKQSSSSGAGTWEIIGGDYYSDTSSSFSQTFSSGLEDLEIDITTLVEQWVNSSGNEAVLGVKDNNGIGIRLTSSLESYFSSSTGANTSNEIHNVTGSQQSYYTKRFFARETEFYFKRPTIEARWNNSRQDDRGSFYISSSLATLEDNTNTVYLYNNIRGRLRDIPLLGGSPDIYVDIYDEPGGTKISGSFTGSNVSTGIYDCNIVLNTTSSTVYDVWFSGSNQYHTGTISVKSFNSLDYNPEQTYILSMPQLRNEYRKNQTHRLNLYVRKKDWSPNIHNVATRTSIPSLMIPSASYQIKRSIDDLNVISYGTGSSTEPAYTALSYDVSGSYFNLDTSCLESGYKYKIQYSFYDEENGWEEQPYSFDFRVVD